MPVSENEMFHRVVVDHMVKTGTRVSWRLQDEYAVIAGIHYQLEVGESGIPAADDWTPVENADGVDIISLLDEVQHDFGVLPITHYRLQATLPDSRVFYSNPIGCWGHLNRRDWLRARALVRRERLRMRTGAGAYGWLFKKRVKTQPIQNTDVVDFATGEIVSTTNTGAAGTDLLGGYFAPYYMWLDLTPESFHSHRDDMRGQVDDINTSARAIAYPELAHGDVWANATSDARYEIGAVKVATHIRGVPVVVEASLSQVDLHDPIYDLDLPPLPPLQTEDREEF